MAADASAWYAGKTFTSDWASHHIPTWTSIFAARRDTIVDALEIGSFEGRSAIFWLNYFPTCRLVCIDDFAGSPEHRDMNLQHALPLLEQHFDENLGQYGDRVEKIKARSIDALASLGIAGRCFDFVYVDGGHRAVEAYADATLAWPLLKPGGLLLFDDYTWTLMPNEMDRPKPGIDAFLQASQGTYRELLRDLQILIEKLAVAA